ncbi:EAL domain-containing protein [Thiomicrorhabdus cannonii]|uniref:EAL domain-containing protein n=1 Tax=Thiomicrorhabdus cannonii TaxID=2748011 RepID=UPI0015B834E0|nr:EAL domain-containing protein [Thiomicrorhabdus cannonii]
MMWTEKTKNASLFDALFAVLLSVAIWAVLLHGIYQSSQKEIQADLHEIISKQEMAWLSVQKMFHQGAEVRFQMAVNNPEVLSILERAQDPTQTQQARLDLYRALYPYYQKRLNEHDGHFHLHFHTPDNRSFLRFHQPEMFGDDLSAARPSIVEVNRTLTPVYAFETGKVISGLRHIFPIIYHGKHLGSVEFGQRFEALRQEIAAFNPQDEYNIVYKRDLIEGKYFKQFSYLYAPSPFSSHWLQEDPYSVLKHAAAPLSPTVQAIAALAKQDPNFDQQLADGQSFAKTFTLNGKTYTLCLTPVHDIHQQNIAYLFSVGESDQIQRKEQRFLTESIVLSVIMLLIGIGIWRLLVSQRQQKEHRSYLQRINNTLSEGLYVTDRNGCITMVNTAAQNTLGYTDTEMLGQNAHDLFHSSEDPQDCSQHCPIETATLSGNAYHGELVFITKEQQPIWVSVSGQPLYIGNVNKGMVVSFNDISAQKAQDEALRIAATAFETQEGIMITDPKGNVLQVNQAFTRLTGYEAEDVIGKTPKILNSGMQDHAFYEQMWQTLLRHHYWQGEIWNKRKNGDVYLEWLTITGVVNHKGVLTHFVASFSDATERHKAQEEIQKLAFYDPLTKLPNRRLFLDRLEHALIYSQRTRQCGALFFIDLDNFKTLNDTRGHLIGDLLLKEVSKRLLDNVRMVDTVSRIGGDEFVILLENLGENTDKAVHYAENIALNILQAFRQPFILNGESHHSSPSIGIEIIRCEHNSPDELLTHADLAMYQAKKQGRNNVRFFDPQMQTNVEKLVSLQSDLREALEQNQFELYYQPQVNQYAEIIYAEALIRWKHPQKGYISPADFIPVAEESGQIIAIGDWVLQTACETLVKWQQEPVFALLKLAVNVSAKQFAEKDFVEKVTRVLEETGADPNQLKLELTESVTVKDLETTIRTMNALRDIGVRFSIDDFGTGHSSLSYLKRLPLSQLKIDQSFIRDLTVDSDDAIIVKTIIAMSNTLKLEVIAEGVETIEQKEFLKENHCTVYQGYLFSPPLPLEKFENLVRTTLEIHFLDA